MAEVSGRCWTVEDSPEAVEPVEVEPGAGVVGVTGVAGDRLDGAAGEVLVAGGGVLGGVAGLLGEAGGDVGAVAGPGAR
jgi:hypothetical protein